MASLSSSVAGSKDPAYVRRDPAYVRRGPTYVRRAFFVALVVVLLAGRLLRPAAAQTSAPDAAQQAQALQRRAAERLASLQKEAESLARQERTVLVELRTLEVQREIKVEELAAVERQAAEVEKKLADTTARARALQTTAERQRPEVEERMVRLYKMGRAGYWRLLLDVSSLQEVGRAYRTAAALARIDRDRIEEHRRTLAALDQERAALQARAKEVSALKKRARDAQAALDNAVTAHANLVKQIDARRDLNAQLTGELQDAQQKLRATLAQLASGQPVAPATLPMRPFQGALPYPADGVVLLKFGRPRAAAAAAPPSGIELSLPEGEPVHAVYDGTVAYADPFSGFGNLVIVDHGDRCYSLYGHLSSTAVKKGDHVDQGSTVGLAGRNPSGNPSLYFELRIDGKAVDPLQWLKRP